MDDGEAIIGFGCQSERHWEQMMLSDVRAEGTQVFREIDLSNSPI